MIKRLLVAFALVAAAASGVVASADPKSADTLPLPGGRFCTEVLFDDVTQTVCIPTP